MSDNKVKISQLPIKEELDGQEVFLAAHTGSNFGVTLDAIKKYTGPITLTQKKYDDLPNKVEGQTYYIVD